MRRRIFFHGRLKKLCPDPIEVDAATVGEAIKIVTSQIPALRPNIRDGYQRVQVSGCHKLEDFFAPNDMEEIHVRPAFHGGKSGGFLQILLGAVLIAASFIPGVGAVFATLLMKVGVMLLLGGILQLIAAPQRDRDAATAQSHYLGAPKNTVAIGTRIPILFGRRKIGGHYLSFNIDAIEA